MFVYYKRIVFCFVFLRLVYPMLAVSLGGLLFTLFVFVYNTHIVFLFCFSSSCWQFLWEGSYLRYLCLFTVHILCFCFVFLRLVYPMLAVSLWGALIYVICVCLLYTYCVFVLFFFFLFTLCWQFLCEGSYLRYLCLFTINVLCFFLFFFVLCTLC
jgi:hypothetical protein